MALFSSRPLLNRRARRLSTFCVALGALSLAGCAQDSAGAPASGVARSWSEAWHRVRASLSIGRAYDSGLMAARNNDTQAFEQARRDLQALDAQMGARSLLAQAPLSQAEEEVARGIYWSTQRSRAASPEQKAIAEQKEAESYRRALKISGGNFRSNNAELLNALGYFLADKGRDAEDFQNAEKLTRRAIALHDQAVQDAKQKSGADSVPFAAARFSRANTRDSLAWSLFWQAGTQSSNKQRAAVLLEKARAEQEAAVKEAREASEESLSAELLYHLTVILSAQNVISPTAERREQALELLSEALELQPDFEPVQRAIELLT